MKRFVNRIEDHRWADFCQDMIERRDAKKYNKNCNFDGSISEYGEFYNNHGDSTVHLRAEEISSSVAGLVYIPLQLNSKFSVPSFSRDANIYL